MIKKAYVDTPSGQIHYRHGGSQGGTPIIFLHQNTSSSRMFQRTLELLADRHRVVAFDLPGFGESYDPPPFNSISKLTEAVMEAIDAVGVNRFHVCGQHTGAGMAAEMGARFPDRVCSVMMIGPLLLTEEEKAWYRKTFSGSATPDKEGTYLMETWHYLENIGATAAIDLHHDEMWQALRAWRARGMVYRCVWDYPFEEFYMKLTCPMLVMAAPDDVLYQGYLRSKAARPDAVAVELKGSNFEPHLDPVGTSTAIRGFLAGLAS